MMFRNIANIFIIFLFYKANGVLSSTAVAAAEDQPQPPVAAISEFQPYNVSVDTWDEEYRSGKWNYLGKSSIERSKVSVIVALIDTYKSAGANILDVGCGVGTLADNLSPEQRKLYLGLDISAEAIEKGKQARPGLQLQVAQSETFTSDSKYDVIIFNEMLYYVDHQAVLQRFRDNILAENGIIITSVWYNDENKDHRIAISRTSRHLLQQIDKIEVSGNDIDPVTHQKVSVSFSVEVYKYSSSVGRKVKHNNSNKKHNLKGGGEEARKSN